jgi:iron complex transport system substrate-binding protein
LNKFASGHVRRGLLAAMLVVSALSVAGAGAVGAAAGQTQEDCTFPVTETDATGTEVTIDEAPDRIVTGGASSAQTLWEIGARDRVVGVTEYATYLEGADERENVTGPGLQAVTDEVVVGLEPDLVLAPEGIMSGEEAAGLRDAGVTVFVLERPSDVEGIVEKTRLVGRLTGACEGADARADRMEENLATVEEAVEGEERPTALYVYGGGNYVYTAGEESFIGSMIETAGATNLAAEEGLGEFAQLNDEFVASVDPDYVIVNSQSGVPQGEVYQNLTAVQEGRVIELNVDYLNQPAPRTIGPIREMAQTFHPEAYAEANATATPTEMTPSETPTAVTPSDSPTDATPSETPVGSPGMGVSAALVALAGAALLAARRRP